MYTYARQAKTFPEVISIEVRINKEVRDYQENLFFGLSLRRLLFALPVVSVARWSILACGTWDPAKSVRPARSADFVGRGGGMEQKGISSDDGSGEIGQVCVLATFPFVLGGFFACNG